jgi:adenine-specific DNA-methyltransferase
MTRSPATAPTATPAPRDGCGGFVWSGKTEAAELVSTPAAGELLPRREESEGWDTTDNLFIEGENLDALKLLGETHADRVKMIYIDPPYNTGRKFIYTDRNHLNPGESLAASPPGPDGDSHSGWLGMMYPRLILARRLMREDGVIFISIDDNELPRLRIVCDEVFGEENFVAVFTWQTKRAARGVPPTNLLMVNHEYVVCYARSKAGVRFRGLDRDVKDFANPGGDPRGPWRSESMKATGSQDNYFTIKDPGTGRGFHANWAFAESTLEAMIADNRVMFPSDPGGTPRQKKFFDDYRNPTKAAVTALGWHSTEKATKQLMELFDGRKVFDFPKPLSLLRFFCEQTLSGDDIALDFFAGSAGLAQAVMELNETDGGRRRFIMVQRPEPCDHKSSTSDAGYATIADIGKDRIRKVIRKIQGERRAAGRGDGPGLGLRLYQLG